MKRFLTVIVAACLVTWVGSPRAQAWMIAQDVEQLSATAPNNLEWQFDGHVRTTGGGKDPANNAFVGANIQFDKYIGPPDPAPAVQWTLARFLGIDATANAKATIAQSPGVKRNFGVFGDGPHLPRMVEMRWMDGTTLVASVPAPTVLMDWTSFNRVTGRGTVTVTITDETNIDDLKISAVGYRVLPINSFTLAHLNRNAPGSRAGMPPSTFTPSGIADGTVLQMNAANSASFVVSNVGVNDDVVVYLTAEFNTLAGSSTGNWVAWNSGTYIPARKPYRGRVMLPAISATDAIRNASVFVTELLYTDNQAHGELFAKTPFDAITPVGAAPAARFFAQNRVKVFPGTMPLEYTRNSAWSDLLLVTTGGTSGAKKSYLRTAAECVYKDVRVTARVLPGASSNSSLGVMMLLKSDDYGGPVAIRINPAGDSYFASVLTRNPTQLDLIKEIGGVKTVIATTGPNAKWDNGDWILIDRTDPYPMPAPPNPYVPTVYDIDLSAVGAVITMKVTEANVPARTKTLTAIDPDLVEGYVGLRTERDGSLDFSPDTNGNSSVKFETMVQNYVIDLPEATYALKIGVGSTMSTANDAPSDDGGTLPAQRSDSVVSDAEIAQMLYDMGIEAKLLQTSYDLDQFTERGAYASGCTNPAGCTWPAGGPAQYAWTGTVPFGQTLPFFETPLNGTYNAYYQSGTSAAAATYNGTALLNVPIVFGEHGLGTDRRCENLGATVNRNAADACAVAGGTFFDAHSGLFNTNSGDFRGNSPGGINPWGGNLYPHPDSIRILSAAEGGNPTHPIVDGLSDGTGTALTKVYAYPWRHYVTAGDPVTAGASILAMESNAALAGGVDGTVNSHPAWGLVVAETGTARRFQAPDANLPNATFPARNVFLWIGDHVFHRLTAVGREIARRSIYYSLGLPIPTSSWMNYGDFDEDGDTDLTDFGHFQACFNGPNRPYALGFEGGCADVDIDGDGDVDLTDFGKFQSCFNGPNRPPNAGCPTPPISIAGSL